VPNPARRTGHEDSRQPTKAGLLKQTQPKQQPKKRTELSKTTNRTETETEITQKRWHSKYLVLYDGSKSGVKRLELFESEIKFKKQSPVKIIPLVDCVRIVTCQRHKTTFTFEVSHLRTLARVKLLAANRNESLLWWLRRRLLAAAVAPRGHFQEVAPSARAGLYATGLPAGCAVGDRRAASALGLQAPSQTGIARSRSGCFVVMLLLSLSLSALARRLVSLSFVCVAAAAASCLPLSSTNERNEFPSEANFMRKFRGHSSSPRATSSHARSFARLPSAAVCHLPPSQRRSISAANKFFVAKQKRSVAERKWSRPLAAPPQPRPRRHRRQQGRSVWLAPFVATNPGRSDKLSEPAGRRAACGECEAAALRHLTLSMMTNSGARKLIALASRHGQMRRRRRRSCSRRHGSERGRSRNGRRLSRSIVGVDDDERTLIDFHISWPRAKADETGRERWRAGLTPRTATT
jgi:hypothetical protein